MAEKHLNFKVDYKKLNIFDEFNTKDINSPLILSVPHAGTVIPEEFLANTVCTVDELRSNEDSFVQDLVKGAAESGNAMLVMNIARAFVDVNRDKIEIDPGMFYNHPQKDSPMGTRRCRVGLGAIHRITAQNKNIYDGLLDYNEVLLRLKNVYDPYHKRLQQLIDKTLKKFGFAFVLDCHSMPSKICSIMNDGTAVEFCLGTLFEQSCPAECYEFFKESLSSKGYNVTYNCPYSGAYITFNYCQPRKKIYTLQLETNRGLYMEENVYKKSADFQKVSTDICSSIQALTKFLLDFKN